MSWPPSISSTKISAEAMKSLRCAGCRWDLRERLSGGGKKSRGVVISGSSSRSDELGRLGDAGSVGGLGG